MSDILTRLLLDTKDYDSKLGKAKKSSNDFAANIGGKAAAAVGKFAAGIGLAMGGVEAFNKAIGSSQKLGDKYNETMQGLKSSIDSFFYSISNGDWSSFITGMDSVISKSKAAYLALDQLGNTQMSFNIAQAINQRDIAEAQQLAKNKFAPIDVRTSAFDKWREAIVLQENQSKQLAIDIKDYITKAVESKAGLKGFNANMDNVLKGLLLDIQNKKKREILKEQYAGLYKDFETKLEASANERARRRKSSNLFERNTAESYFQDSVNRLTKEYNEAITIHSLLNKYKDEELNAIGQYVKSMIGLDGSVAMLKREYNETANEFNNANKSLKGFKPKEAFEGYAVYSGNSEAGKNFAGGGGKTEKPIAGSLAALNAEIAVAQKAYANAATDSARKAAYEALRKLEEKKGLIELHAKVVMPEVGSGKSGSLAALAGGVSYNFDAAKLKGLINKDNVNTTYEFADGLNSIANAISAINSVTGEGAAAFFSWAASVATASAQVVESIRGVVAAKSAETVASSGASAASTPVVGWLMVGGAIAAALAAIANIPKFEKGGIIGGSSFFGDKLLARVNSGEMILNQSQQAKLLAMTEGSNVRVSGDVRLSGKDIYIALHNYMSVSGNKL